MAKALMLLGLLLSPLVVAANSGLGVYFENGNEDVALLKLDYATYRATYNATYDVRLRTAVIELSCQILIQSRSMFSRTSGLQHRLLEI
jgi:hypothetical protein